MKDYEREIREEWFKDHVASLRKLEGGEGPPVFHLRWGKPGTNIFRIHYLMNGGCLAVTGDLGDAIYWWSMTPAYLTVPFQCLAQYGLDYFAGKCQASEFGRDYREWSEEVAEQALRDQVENGLGLGLPPGGTEAKLRGDRGYGEDAYDNIGSADEWAAWLGHHSEDVFGPDCMEMWDIGMQVALRCRSHLIGIKMAVEQLKARETT